MKKQKQRQLRPVLLCSLYFHLAAERYKYSHLRVEQTRTEDKEIHLLDNRKIPSWDYLALVAATLFACLL